MSTKKIIGLIVAAVIVIACGIGGYMGYQSHKINEMRADGVEQLESIVSLDDYRTDEQEDVQAIIDKYTGKIETAKEQAKVDGYIQKATDEISKIKTDAQLTKEEKKAAEEAAKKKAEEEAAAAAAAAAASQSSGSSGGGSSNGCVGNDASNFY